MGRPKLYATRAEQQAAYRQRLEAEMVHVRRRAYDQLQAKLEHLHDAIYHAARAGNPAAQQVSAARLDTTLDKLAAWFNQRTKEDHTNL